ncbi:PrsW family intramembrane metalloprotease [Spirochaeta isovalerica]|nr:PrsW family glutamic-type intramembrane protease [Spirochaeta isovalerica]
MIIALAGKIALFSILPAVLLISLLLSSHKGKTPDPKIFFKLLSGGLLILIPAVFAVSLLSGFFEGKGFVPELLSPFIAVSLIEESAKLTVIWLLLRRLPEGRTTGAAMIYSTAAAIGFAIGENILYLTGTDSIVPLMLLRGITSLPLHALCGAFMGLFLSENLRNTGSFSFLSLFVPVLLHGTYNTILRLPSFWPILIFPLLAGMFVLLIKLKASQEKN